MSVNEVKIRKAEIDFEVRGTGHPGSRTFAIGDEDHTIGNSLRHVLMNNSNVSFAGYSVPHPSEPIVHIRVQTAENSKRRESSDMDADDGGRMTAIDALKEACQTLSDQCDIVLDQLEEALPEVREDRLKMEEIAATEGYEDAEDEMAEAEGEEEGDYYEDE
uniref:DNA-directed RNA polymerase RBP11-like dimerisation domain-containing protein n=1 Tax=Odontella aurita TaxID=265563 RepID=A0A7S4KC12_9STRA|mmetsp:Transcript_9135/g.27428  ORF Transcript_9135/g.27428 Transcript_9135/m.27428 type:complete len:162 (+) Transcript_9135:143-628(+)|eukprot:CAMPEP_0113558674 /NCGR_PEP_ID=MMETSP0015_2-20120614/18478_1 /TAXON_ID=2838 /ORGANISM="Odontella" /LENGTH=161 /DNA_ID=CAMNT_0000460237 /DNA_START=152 /DNA_END=637 /DNA_ORIENTATION=+ /assembly_acc=CAM_ASM_000160